jgi:hypothetical protein
MKQIPVSEFMARDLTSARKEMPLAELVALFKEKKAGLTREAGRDRRFPPTG